MTRLPVISGAALLRLLERAGFAVTRSESSHYVVKHPDGRWTIVPVHANRDLTRTLLRKILRQAGISIEQYLDLLG
jgi:predicted RNA binding protein YcfA (HicA-like mRNA interferase family)